MNNVCGPSELQAPVKTLGKGSHPPRHCHRQRSPAPPPPAQGAPGNSAFVNVGLRHLPAMHAVESTACSRQRHKQGGRPHHVQERHDPNRPVDCLALQAEGKRDARGIRAQARLRALSGRGRAAATRSNVQQAQRARTMALMGPPFTLVFMVSWICTAQRAQHGQYG